MREWVVMVVEGKVVPYHHLEILSRYGDESKSSGKEIGTMFSSGRERVGSFVTCHAKPDGTGISGKRSMRAFADIWWRHRDLCVLSCKLHVWVFAGVYSSLLATLLVFPSEIPPLHVIGHIPISVVGSSVCLAGGGKMLRRHQLLVFYEYSLLARATGLEGVVGWLVGSLCACEMTHLSLRSA